MSFKLFTQGELSRNRAIAYIVIAAALWSSSGLFIKIIDLGPMPIAGIRSAIATLLMIAVLNKRLRFTWSFHQIAGAFAYALTVTTFVIATKLTTAANAILLQYTMPVFTAILAAWLLKEKVRRFDWVIIWVVLGGMALFFLDSLTPGGLQGNLIAILSAVAFASMVILMRFQKLGSPVETIVLGNIITAAVCLPFVIAEPPAATDLLPLAYMGIFQIGLSFIIYSTAIKYVTAVDAALVQTIEPLLNPIWVFLVVGETPGLWALIGGAVVLTAVTIRNIKKAAPDPKHEKT